MESINNFVGENEDIRPIASLENYITGKTPQSFIWHTFLDTCVPVANSMRFAAALEEKNVKFEMHIYPRGVHGLSLADEIVTETNEGIIPAVQNWIDMSIRWIKEFEID